MRKFWAAIMISVTALVATGCESSRLIENRDVPCLGVDDQNRRNPAYDYEVSTRNVVFGLLFFEAFFIPTIVVLLDEFYCPVTKAPDTRAALAMVNL